MIYPINCPTEIEWCLLRGFFAEVGTFCSCFRHNSCCTGSILGFYTDDERMIAYYE